MSPAIVASYARWDFPARLPSNAVLASIRGSGLRVRTGWNYMAGGKTTSQS